MGKLKKQEVLDKLDQGWRLFQRGRLGAFDGAFMQRPGVRDGQTIMSVRTSAFSALLDTRVIVSIAKGSSVHAALRLPLGPDLGQFEIEYGLAEVEERDEQGG